MPSIQSGQGDPYLETKVARCLRGALTFDEGTAAESIENETARSAKSTWRAGQASHTPPESHLRATTQVALPLPCSNISAEQGVWLLGGDNRYLLFLCTACFF